MPEAVLDSSAVIALVKREPGADLVAKVIATSFVSAVNHAEIVSKLIDWCDYAYVSATLATLSYRVIDFDRALAIRAGQLRSETRALGLSLGDRACLALAERDKLPVFTTDREWKKLKLGIEINVLR